MGSAAQNGSWSHPAEALPFGRRGVFVVKGEFVYRGGTARTGDYGFEPMGAYHDEPRAAVETVLFYIGYGPLALLNPDGSLKGVMGAQVINDFAAKAAAVKQERAA